MGLPLCFSTLAKQNPGKLMLKNIPINQIGEANIVDYAPVARWGWINFTWANNRHEYQR